MATSTRRFSLADLLFGRPLQTADIPHQTLSKKVGLAIFASDNLSSIAYATEEILIVLALAGTAYFVLSIPISIIIATMLVMLVISYRQTIYAYPNGGGAYVVAHDNLGEWPAQTAAAALLTDYILTVAVSVSSGVAQIASAFPALHPFRVEIAIAMIAIMTIINLRGVRESGMVFAIPTYFFIVMMFMMLGVGFYQLLTGTLGTVTGVEDGEGEIGVQALTLFLLLRAFASGSAAVTGVEAISNGITAFKEPRSQNAARTLIVMAAILGITFISITILANAVHVVAYEGVTETVVSQIARTIFAEGSLYLLTVISVTVILILAANTSYAGFPRLAALAAGDGYLPKQLTFRGRRLVFSWGIVALALAASLLIVVFDAETTQLIPLYAIGVFLSFTLSQSGMVVRWRRIGRMRPGEEIATHDSVLRYDPHWRGKLIINAVGSVMTGVVMLVFAVAKFAQGAWIVVILIPALVYVFFRIHRHYRDVAHILSQGSRWPNLRPRPVKTLVLVDDIHAGTIHTINFAKSLGVPWTAVHVAIDPEKAEQVKEKWQERIGDEAYLTVLPSPYRNLVDPVREYVLKLLEEMPNGFIHVIVGHLVMDKLREQALHENAAIILNLALQDVDHATVTTVSYRLETHANGKGGRRTISVTE
ncbi:MAG TPA: APC family permease [Anaerolineae bacterium]|nr:APC family permease [Anaerolineae bacterium]